MRNQNGFTLIEMVVVIVILGILAAVAIPKFIDLQADARLSTVNGLAGAIQGASALGHAQALVSGTVSGTVNMEGPVLVAHGYPEATSAGIVAALNLDGFTVTYGTDPATATFELDSGGAAGCSVVYTGATIAGTTITPPVINNTATLDNCQ